MGKYLIPLAIGTALNCLQAIFSNALNGTDRQRDSARTVLLCSGIQLVFTLLTVRRWGLSGYIAGYLVSSLLGVEANRKAVGRILGLRASIYLSVLPFALAAVLLGFCVDALFHRLLGLGLSLFTALAISALFGIFLYLAALQAQGKLPKQKTGKG